MDRTRDHVKSKSQIQKDKCFTFSPLLHESGRETIIIRLVGREVKGKVVGWIGAKYVMCMQTEHFVTINID